MRVVVVCFVVLFGVVSIVFCFVWIQGGLACADYFKCDGMCLFLWCILFFVFAVLLVFGCCVCCLVFLLYLACYPMCCSCCLLLCVVFGVLMFVRVGLVFPLPFLFVCVKCVLGVCVVLVFGCFPHVLFYVCLFSVWFVCVCFVVWHVAPRVLVVMLVCLTCVLYVVCLFVFGFPHVFLCFCSCALNVFCFLCVVCAWP